MAQQLVVCCFSHLIREVRIVKRKDVKRNGAAALSCLLLSIPLYFFYRANLEYEWLFNLVAIVGMFLLIFRVFGPVIFTYFARHVPGSVHADLLGNRIFRRFFIVEKGDSL